MAARMSKLAFEECLKTGGGKNPEELKRDRVGERYGKM